MNSDIAITILICLVGTGVSIMLAGIPWAYSVHGRLTCIETSLSHTVDLHRKMEQMEKRLARVEIHQEDEE
ncbi:MAG: hypothetical protein COA78_37190 [Blastopirellula sp.]|nr:MAG: hypothetical protein COA78_37190 [Blastopirellula sp.]